MYRHFKLKIAKYQFAMLAFAKKVVVTFNLTKILSDSFRIISIVSSEMKTFRCFSYTILDLS
jgi:hypothetical protein